MTESKVHVDLRGLTCPEPVIRTKKLFDSPDTQTIEALVDDDICVNNLQRLASALRIDYHVEDNNGYFTITLERASQVAKATQHAHPAPLLTSSALQSSEVGTVVFLSRETLGDGDHEFGKTLLNVFLQTIFDSGLRPRAILLVNSAVKLMSKSSSALKVLDDLKNAGCAVFACGLCVDFYKLKDDIARDQITNMFAICEYLFAAEKIIQP